MKTSWLLDITVSPPGIVVHKVAVEDGLFGAVGIDLVLEQAEGMGRRCGGEADFHGVEVVQDIFPAAGFFGRVSPVALVGDDHVEGVDGDIEPVGFGVVLEAAVGVFAQQVDGHPLDGGDVDEGVGFPGVGQVLFGQHLGVEAAAVFQLFAAESLAVDLVIPVQFEPLRRLKGGEGGNGLGGEGAPVHQEENPPGVAGFQKAVDGGNEGEGFAGSCGHGDQHALFAGAQGFFDGFDGGNLIRSQAGYFGDGPLSEPSFGGFRVFAVFFEQGPGGVEIGQQPGCVFFSAHVEMVDGLSVGGIEEGNPVPPPFAYRVRYAAGVSLGLFQHVFGAEGDFFGFYDAEQLSVHKQGVVGGAGLGGVFFHGVVRQRRTVADFVAADESPAEDG